jgi:hypothetical protein
MTLEFLKMRHNICLLLSFGIISCGIFSPREVEPPAESAPKDPLNFSDILINSGSGERFSDLDYEILFHDSMTYRDEIGRANFDKNAVRGRLNSIISKYSDIEVRWDVAEEDQGENVNFDRDEIAVLDTRKYRAYRGAMTITVDTAAAEADTTYEIDYRGEAAFKLKYNDLKNTWTIWYWRDVPLGNLEKSFFHPEFQR